MKGKLTKNKKELTPRFFKLGWEWYEDWNYYFFVHFEKTQKQFKQDVKSLLIKYGEDYLKNEKSWAGAMGWIEFIVDKMPELGYKLIKPISEVFFGAYIIENNSEEDNKNWSEIVGEELFQRAILHNKKIKKEINNKIKKFSKHI